MIFISQKLNKGIKEKIKLISIPSVIEIKIGWMKKPRLRGNGKIFIRVDSANCNIKLPVIAPIVVPKKDIINIWKR